MDEGLTLEEQREAAQVLFPDKWAETLHMPGWRRRRRQANLRKAAISALILRTLPADARCGNCSNRGRRDGKLACELESDFHGYMVIKAEGRCARWSR